MSKKWNIQGSIKAFNIVNARVQINYMQSGTFLRKIFWHQMPVCLTPLKIKCTLTERGCEFSNAHAFVWFLVQIYPRGSRHFIWKCQMSLSTGIHTATVFYVYSIFLRWLCNSNRAAYLKNINRILDKFHWFFFQSVHGRCLYPWWDLITMVPLWKQQNTHNMLNNGYRRANYD